MWETSVLLMPLHILPCLVGAVKMHKIAALLGENVSATWPRTVSRGRCHRGGLAGTSEEGDDAEDPGLVMSERP